MNAAHLIEQVRHAGGSLRLEHGALKVSAPHPLPSDFVDTLKAHKAELLATLIGEDLREAFEERAAILEHQAGLSREHAEREAARMIATKASNLGYSWDVLRHALSYCPTLLAQVPTESGIVDRLLFGVSRFTVWRKAVIRQGRG